MKFKSMTLILTLFTVSSLQAYAPLDTVYAITPVDETYLTYYSVVNPFDSATVRYEFGEVSQRTGGSYSRVYLNSTIAVNDYLPNDGTPGTQSTLQAALTTATFYVDYSTDTIAFYRNLTVRPVKYGYTGFPAAWKINDRSIFKVELVRVSDNSVIATLDDVMIDSASLGTPSGAPSGTNASTFCIKAFVPFGVRACSAFVRVTPIRYGSGASAHGMSAMKFAREYSMSAFWSCETRSPNTSHFTTISEKYFEKLIDYYDNYYSSNCAIPFRTGSGELLTEEQLDSIKARYFVVCEEDGIARLIPCESPKAPVRSRSGSVEIDVRDVVASTDKVTATIRCKNPIAGDVVLYNLGGKMVYSHTQMDFAQGENTEVMDVDLTAGRYFVGVRNAKTGAWSFGQVLVP